MNATKTASITMLLLGLGLFNVKPVNARIAEDAKTTIRKLPVEQVDNYTTSDRPSQYRITQKIYRSNSPLYGTWNLTYSINGVVYRSVLIMKGHSGGMGTKYFDSNVGRTRVISQQMRLGSSSRGLILVGFNPTDYHTKRPVRTYSPDNFLFSIQPNGSLVAITCDRAKRCSNVDIEKVR